MELEEGKETAAAEGFLPRAPLPPVLQKQLTHHAIYVRGALSFLNPPAFLHPPWPPMLSLEISNPVLGIWHNPGKFVGVGDWDFCE